MSPKFQKRSALKFVGRIIPCAKHIGISREAEDNATSRKLHRIHPPAGAEGFQITGLKSCIFVEVDDLFVKGIYKATVNPGIGQDILFRFIFFILMYFLTSFMKEYDKIFSSFIRIFNSLLSILINCPQHFPKVESFSSSF